MKPHSQAIMSTPKLTDLVIFNPTLKNDRTTPPSDRQLLVDKEDYDEISQVLFADGPGLKNPQGGVEWNTVLKQMGLAKGLMGFMRCVTRPPPVSPNRRADKDGSTWLA